MASIIIFGGAGGIGAAVARRLAARGDKPHLVGRDPAKLAAIARDIGAPSSLADVTDPAAIAVAVAAAAQDGGLAGLVYAVGTINLKPIGALTEADFERDWRVNALGAALALKAAAPSLKQVEGSSVVLFSTVAVRQGFAAHASVSMAKGAVEGLTLALAAELAPKVRVNCIAPSLTRTPLAEALTRNEALAKAVAETHALRRLGEAEDIAGLAAFLLGCRVDHRPGDRRRRRPLDAAHQGLGPGRRHPCAVGRTTTSPTSTSAGCSIAKAIARAIASGGIATLSRKASSWLFTSGLVTASTKSLWTKPGETIVTRSLSPASWRKPSEMARTANFVPE